MATSATVRSATVTQTIGHVYTFRIKARDAAGNWSAWVESPTFKSSLVSDRSTAIRYSGTWKNALYAPATICLGVVSLPAGWASDRFGAPTMMVSFDGVVRRSAPCRR